MQGNPTFMANWSFLVHYYPLKRWHSLLVLSPCAKKHQLLIFFEKKMNTPSSRWFHLKTGALGYSTCTVDLDGEKWWTLRGRRYSATCWKNMNHWFAQTTLRLRVWCSQLGFFARVFWSFEPRVRSRAIHLCKSVILSLCACCLRLLVFASCAECPENFLPRAMALQPSLHSKYFTL